ncbi:orn/Lys/Arg decarboxylase, N-terminal domain protein, partial [Vibrio parahaemolyticus V-223/04]
RHANTSVVNAITYHLKRLLVA